jgi:hypothetical protein
MGTAENKEKMNEYKWYGKPFVEIFNNEIQFQLQHLFPALQFLTARLAWKWGKICVKRIEE